MAAEGSFSWFRSDADRSNGGKGTCQLPSGKALVALYSLPLHFDFPLTFLSLPPTTSHLSCPPHTLPCPQVDELMRQELKNLRLAVDKEEGRPLKIAKVDEGGGLRRRGHWGGERGTERDHL